MSDLPPGVLTRLKRAEARQRRETLARGLFAEPVDVEEVWRRQGGKCGCGCGLELDHVVKWTADKPPAGYIVIAHRFARGSKGEHTANNVELWRWRCNHEAAAQETTEAASVKRFAVIKGRPRKSSIKSRGFDPKPKGYKRRWPSRSLR